jgi:hypothetical protein
MITKASCMKSEGFSIFQYSIVSGFDMSDSNHFNIITVAANIISRATEIRGHTSDQYTITENF